MAPRETANNAYAKFWDDKQKVLWCVVVFSGVINFVCYEPTCDLEFLLGRYFHS